MDSNPRNSARSAEVFLASPWIPPEWVRAHGLRPRALWLAPNFAQPAAPLPAGVCAFAEATLQFAKAHSETAVVFSSACDQLRRAFDSATLHDHHRAFLFNLPATWQTPVASRIFRAELKRLGRFLLSIGGETPSPEILRREIVRAGAARQRLLQSATNCSARAFAEAVARLHWEGECAPPPRASVKHTPIALLGGPFLPRDWPLLDEIEAAGARVVLNATDSGERALGPVFADEPLARSPFDTLVRAWCDSIFDAFQRPDSRLYSWLKPRLTERGVRGIILWSYTNCDLWRAQAQSLRESFGLPVLPLETGGEPGSAPSRRNRLQAFLETLQ
jgi:benzoyl-CoA reductase/2-hydroxyglutaryl-CoA dehydratase subunit BcrC/BadD/HgdB